MVITSVESCPVMQVLAVWALFEGHRKIIKNEKKMVIKLLFIKISIFLF